MSESIKDVGLLATSWKKRISDPLFLDMMLEIMLSELDALKKYLASVASQKKLEQASKKQIKDESVINSEQSVLRRLKEHGIDPNNATDEQKKFYAKYINPEGQSIFDEFTKIADSKYIGKGISMEAMASIDVLKSVFDKALEGESVLALEFVSRMIESPTLMYDLVPSSQLQLLLDRVPKKNGKKGHLESKKELVKDGSDDSVKLIAKADLSLFGLDGEAIFAARCMIESLGLDLTKPIQKDKLKSLVETFNKFYDICKERSQVSINEGEKDIKEKSADAKKVKESGRVFTEEGKNVIKSAINAKDDYNVEMKNAKTIVKQLEEKILSGKSLTDEEKTQKSKLDKLIAQDSIPRYKGNSDVQQSVLNDVYARLNINAENVSATEKDIIEDCVTKTAQELSEYLVSIIKKSDSKVDSKVFDQIANYVKLCGDNMYSQVENADLAEALKNGSVSSNMLINEHVDNLKNFYKSDENIQALLQTNNVLNEGEKGFVEFAVWQIAEKVYSIDERENNIGIETKTFAQYMQPVLDAAKEKGLYSTETEKIM
ncbi:MAG: hypothetical protein E7361_02370 [Clostridiales bacterium]|nr:hypothetical protein [Clostridiales bacterium]